MSVALWLWMKEEQELVALLQTQPDQPRGIAEFGLQPQQQAGRFLPAASALVVSPVCLCACVLRRCSGDGAHRPAA